MNNKICILLTALVVACCLPSLSHAQIIYASSDAPTYEGAPNTNFNNYNGGDFSAELWTGNFYGSYNTQSFISFDVSGLSSGSSATLNLFNGVTDGAGSSYNNADVTIFAILNPWSETTITWSNQPDMGPEGVTTTVEDEIGWFTWDISELLEYAIDGIIYLGLASDGAGHVYAGSEDGSGFSPYLLVSSVPEPGPVTVILILGIFLAGGYIRGRVRCLS